MRWLGILLPCEHHEIDAELPVTVLAENPLQPQQEPSAEKPLQSSIAAHQQLMHLRILLLLQIADIFPMMFQKARLHCMHHVLAVAMRATIREASESLVQAMSDSCLHQ